MNQLSIRQLIDDSRRDKRVHAGSLIITLFGDAAVPRGGRVWLGSLIRLLQPLDINERLVRTSVFRLAKEDWLHAESRGRRTDYVLTEAGRRRFEEASRHIYASRSPIWDHRWRLIMAVGELAPKDRARIRDALFWQGFGALGADCFVHPGADLSAALDALVAEGLGEQIEALMPLLAADSHVGVSASNADLVRRAWDLEELARDYTDFVESYRPLRDALRAAGQDAVDGQDAFLLRLLLIHDYRRLLLRDPELPDVLLPLDWPGRRARLLCRDIYHRVWGASERYLDQHLQLASGVAPPRGAALAPRFPDDDPLLSL